eukprot:465174-Pelagomonas_calceolata.AAC.5
MDWHAQPCTCAPPPLPPTSSSSPFALMRQLLDDHGILLMLQGVLQSLCKRLATRGSPASSTPSLLMAGVWCSHSTGSARGAHGVSACSTAEPVEPICLQNLLHSHQLWSRLAILPWLGISVCASTLALFADT